MSHPADDDASVRLVMRLVGQVVRTGPFPPFPYDSWSQDAIGDATTRLYLAKGATIAAEAAVAADGDKGHLERRLLKTIRNFFIDEAKATPVGKMRNRLKTMLSRDDNFVRQCGDSVAVDGWAERDTPGAEGVLWQGNIDELRNAASNVPVPSRVVFNKAGPPPPQTRQALLDVIGGVFEAADHLYLADQVLATVMTQRFDTFLNADQRDATEFTAFDPADDTNAAIGDDYSAIDVHDLAAHLWDDMSHDERRTVAVMTVDGGQDARRDAVMAAVGCGPQEADALLNDVFNRIVAFAADTGREAELVELLTHRAAEDSDGAS